MTGSFVTLTRNTAALQLLFSLGAFVMITVGVVVLHRGILLARRSRHLLPFMVNRIADRPWTIRDALTVSLVLVAAYAMQLISASVADSDPVRGTPQALVLLTRTLVMPCAGLLAIGLVLRRRKRSLREMFGLGNRSFLSSLVLAPLCYLAAIPVVLAASLAVQLLLHLLGYPVAPQFIVTFLADADLPGWFYIYFTFLAIIVAPVFEELLFRGILFPVLLRSYPLPLAIGLVSTLFAAIHFHLPSVAPLFVIAAMFCVGYLWSGDIGVPILIHAIFNGVNMLLILLVSKGWF